MATKRAKRSTKANPREDRNNHFHRHSQPNYREPAQNEFEPPRISKTRRVDLIPRNIAQERYIKSLVNPDHHIIFAIGPAGTGKTLLATQYAIKSLQEGLFNRIVITRPAVSVDEQHGFLPGTLIEKMAPWIIPIMDVFKEHYDPKTIIKMIEDEIIEIAPLAYMRGRTFKKCIILGDEIQNTTPSQLKMLTTRIGDGSKMIITGDLNQHDRGFDKNGLKDFIERYENSPSTSISINQFAQGDVERHPVIDEILTIYKDLKE